jgi:hypothetical protein
MSQYPLQEDQVMRYDGNGNGNGNGNQEDEDTDDFYASEDNKRSDQEDERSEGDFQEESQRPSSPFLRPDG